jgi:hypothetical protein
MASVAAPLADADAKGSEAFECNICLELASQPVVTLCGHLYCWPCLYRCGCSRLLSLRHRLTRVTQLAGAAPGLQVQQELPVLQGAGGGRQGAQNAAEHFVEAPALGLTVPPATVAAPRR